ncbi:hypothetical protein D049_1616B, partial [Vibrio parahaemolyticus VPTS-2010]
LAESASGSLFDCPATQKCYRQTHTSESA